VSAVTTIKELGAKLGANVPLIQPGYARRMHGLNHCSVACRDVPATALLRAGSIIVPLSERVS
jgi:hypothetical protein